MRVLAGDIGGTRARIARVEIRDDEFRVLEKREYESGRYDGPAPIIRKFCSGLESVPERACFGMACPVIDGACRLPNLGWEIEADELAREAGIPRLTLINDFDAVGHALGLLDDESLAELQPGTPRHGEPIGLIGAGTGLGQGFLLWSGDRYRVHSSEGGHADFAPRTELGSRLLDHLRQKYGHVSWERVVSGPGLLNIYRFLVEIGYAEERPATRAEMEASDPPQVISQKALEGGDRLCVKALDIFSSAYGAQAGNLALTVKATGGVYVAGGIAPAIIEKLRDGTFIRAFREKGRLSDLVERIPVRVVMEADAGLLGAAAVAADHRASWKTRATSSGSASGSSTIRSGGSSSD